MELLNINFVLRSLTFANAKMLEFLFLLSVPNPRTSFLKNSSLTIGADREEVSRK